MPRCPWCGTDPLYVAYHDHEWGFPERDSRALWELLMLEGFQAGLSWHTILKKRDNFRAAFQGFEPERIATWGADEVNQLLLDPGIVRHRGKIEGTILSAQAYLAISERQTFSDWIWAYVQGQPIQTGLANMTQVQAKTPLAEQMSKDLKKAGFKFCGPTIVYAFMQAAGLVNDHLTDCPRHKDLSTPAAR